jgi:tetratricopeptide (TPR) repeat protein
MQYLTLGQKLRLKRKELDLTLKDIAGDYISPATLSLVERDLQAPSEELLRYLADRLQTPYSYFKETPEETLGRRAKTLLAESEALLHRKRYSMATRFAEEILNDAKELRLYSYIAQSALLLARIALKQEDYHKANEYLFEAQTAAHLSGYHEWLPNIYYQFALVSFRQSFYPHALDYLKQAEQASADSSDDELSRKILSLFSQTYHKMGKFDLALRYAERATHLVARMNNLEAYAESLILLGATYREKEQYDKAFELFQEAMRIFRQLETQHELSEAERNLAELYVKTGDYHRANLHFELAIEQKQKLCDTTLLSTMLDYVEALLEAGEIAKAQSRLQTALGDLDIPSSEEERARALALSYQISCLLGDEAAGRKALEESLNLIRSHSTQMRIPDLLVKLGRICAKAGDPSMAAQLFGEALAGYESLGVILRTK